MRFDRPYKLEEIAAKRYVDPYFLALAHVGLGQKDKALDWLERGVENRDLRCDVLN